MENFKRIVAVVIGVCLMLCFAGCGKDEYDSFDPVGVRVVESIGGTQFERVIDDKKVTQKMWNTFDNLVIDTETRGEMGSSYIYMCFYNEDQSKLGIFTIYENGSCCLGEDFETFYTVTDGEDVYMKLCDIYTSYEAKSDSTQSQ